MTTGLTVASAKEPIEQLAINTIRTLCMDTVQAANSGHPGSPMGMAPAAYVLWQRFLRYDPDQPIWGNRDRFVLSAGHCSTLLYSLLHLTGVKTVNPKYEALGEPSVTIDDLKKFRQLDSKCPGHPEYRWTSGVETTTGPLGQGLATSVGMALASRWAGATFNRPGFEMFDFDVYAMCGDGCMMEGISTEAASLAGHWKLSNLCWIYDSNKITIEGHTDLAFSEDVATKYMGLGWNVTRVGDANDLEMLDRAFRFFKKTSDRPTLIIVESHIAWGARRSRTPVPPTASHWGRKRFGSPNATTVGRKTLSFWCLKASTSTFATASASAARSCARPGGHASRSTAKSTPS